MPHDDDAKKKVFLELDGLSVKFKRVYKRMRDIQDLMKKSCNTLDWRDDQELIQEILEHLPREGITTFYMYDRLLTLQQADKNPPETETKMPDKGGDDDV